LPPLPLLLGPGSDSSVGHTPRAMVCCGDCCWPSPSPRPEEDEGAGCAAAVEEVDVVAKGAKAANSAGAACEDAERGDAEPPVPALLFPLLPVPLLLPLPHSHSNTCPELVTASMWFLPSAAADTAAAGKAGAGDKGDNASSAPPDTPCLCSPITRRNFLSDTPGMAPDGGGDTVGLLRADPLERT